MRQIDQFKKFDNMTPLLLLMIHQTHHLKKCNNQIPLSLPLLPVEKHSTRKRKKPATIRLKQFKKKNKIPEPDSSSEYEVGFDETKLCDDSSDELSDDESYVQTSLSLDNSEADDHIFVECESERTKQYYVGRVLEVTEKKIRSTFMRKKCCDKFGNVQFYFSENPDICLHPL